jgi:hypothetical protein
MCRTVFVCNVFPGLMAGIKVRTEAGITLGRGRGNCACERGVGCMQLNIKQKVARSWKG